MVINLMLFFLYSLSTIMFTIFTYDMFNGGLMYWGYFHHLYWLLLGITTVGSGYALVVINRGV
jgi:hypothetical protein